MSSKAKDAFRTISEVADWLNVQAHVLRFWESKFTQIKPVKRAGGRRYYRPADMALLGGIKKLLHDDGMTIKGAQKVLKEQGVAVVQAMSAPLEDDLEAPQTDIAEPAVMRETSVEKPHTLSDPQTDMFAEPPTTSDEVIEDVPAPAAPLLAPDEMRPTDPPEEAPALFSRATTEQPKSDEPAMPRFLSRFESVLASGTMPSQKPSEPETTTQPNAPTEVPSASADPAPMDQATAPTGDDPAPAHEDTAPPLSEIETPDFPPEREPVPANVSEIVSNAPVATPDEETSSSPQPIVDTTVPLPGPDTPLIDALDMLPPGRVAPIKLRGILDQLQGLREKIDTRG